jgi:predicted Rossmann fold flavoprotein
MMNHDVLIIGGGASGITAAIIAKEYGTDVAILEAGNRIGRKILTTGNGRCNITNRCIKPPYVNFHSFNNGFYQSTLDQLTVDDTLNLLYRLGIPTVELKRGKLYPHSLQAASVVDVLRMNLEERDIPVYTETKVLSIQKKADGFLLEVNHPDFNRLSCRRLVIATGGLAAPQTGSDGSILDSLLKLGHRVTTMLPTIVQLKLDYPKLKAISGVRFDAKVDIKVNKKVVRTDTDEILFTDYGISGPAILQVSRNASIALSENKKVEVVVDLFFNQTKDELIDFLETHFSLFPSRSIQDALNGIIHKKLIPIILKDAGIEDIHKTCDLLDYQEKNKLYQLLKGWTFTCIDTNGFNNAQSTIGGIDTKEVDSQTLESKIIPGLFLCGEVLDVDGDCGGFNLQWAWSSGYVVGKSVRI